MMLQEKLGEFWLDKGIVSFKLLRLDQLPFMSITQSCNLLPDNVN